MQELEWLAEDVQVGQECALVRWEGVDKLGESFRNWEWTLGRRVGAHGVLDFPGEIR